MMPGLLMEFYETNHMIFKINALSEPNTNTSKGSEISTCIGISSLLHWHVYNVGFTNRYKQGILFNATAEKQNLFHGSIFGSLRS